MTTRIHNSLFLVIIAVINIFTTSVSAAPAPIITSTQSQNGTSNSFGIGYTKSVAKRPFVGVHDQSASLPYFSYKLKQFYIEGLDIGYKLHDSKTFTTSLLTSPRFYEVKSSFARGGELTGIDETTPSYFGGISTQLQTTIATYTLQILRDLVESEGNEYVIQASKTFRPRKGLSLTPSIGLTYQDKNLVSYFYGVQSNEVIAGRPQYDGNSSLNYNATMNASWYFTKHIELLAQFKYEVLGDGIADSPIVDEEAVSFITLGAVYRF